MGKDNAPAPVCATRDHGDAVQHLKAGDPDGEGRRIDHDILRHEYIDAVDSAEIHRAVTPLAICTLIEFRTLQPITDIIIAERMPGGIIARDAFIGAQPQPARPVFENAGNGVVRQAVCFCMMDERPVRSVTFIQASTQRAYPHHAR